VPENSIVGSPAPLGSAPIAAAIRRRSESNVYSIRPGELSMNSTRLGGCSGTAGVRLRSRRVTRNVPSRPSARVAALNTYSHGRSTVPGAPYSSTSTCAHPAMLLKYDRGTPSVSRSVNASARYDSRTRESAVQRARVDRM
jgi:hypothetical protein